MTQTQSPPTRWQAICRDLLPAHKPRSGRTHAPPAGSPPIKLVCVSDTHNTTPILPPGDILLHAGDLTEFGTVEEMQAQLDWLGSLSYAHKIVIAGNHELLLDPAFADEMKTKSPDQPPLDWHDITYIENSSVELTVGTRTVKIFGSPNTPAKGKGSFGYPPADDVWAGRVPADTDILLTHGPPRGYVDKNKGGKECGCLHLLREIWRVKPKVVVCGHIHHSRGRVALEYNATTRVQDLAAMGQYPSLGEALAARLPSAAKGRTLIMNASAVGLVRSDRDVDQVVLI
jgi:predicted phosphodiesterase